MKIEIVMQHDDFFRTIGDVSVPAIRQYAARRGYAFHFQNGTSPIGASWAKVPLLRARLDGSGADYVFWIDADVALLRDDFDLSSILSGLPMDVSQDAYGLCAGVFGLLNCQWSRRLLDAWWFLGQKDSDAHGCTDQATLKFMEENFRSVRDGISRIPESAVSNPSTHEPEAKPFLHHFWARAYAEKQQVRAMILKAHERTA